MKSEVTELVVFDLNKTLYKKSSKDEFFKFISKKKKYKAFHIFTQWKYHALKKINLISNTEFKENFFNYLDNIPPQQVKQYAEEFWKQEYPSQFNEELLKRITTMRKKDLKIYCATGALEIYLDPLKKMLPLDAWIGTKTIYSNDTYLIEGKACNGEEKIKRIKEITGKPFSIVEAYSDTLEEILKEADMAYLIKDGKIDQLD